MGKGPNAPPSDNVAAALAGGWKPIETPPPAAENPTESETRVGSDLFYDQDIVGLTGSEQRGHRGLDADRFFMVEDHHTRAHFMVRVARNPWAFAGILFGFGFFSVFVRQASFLLQVILGAPIFEEMVKFGLALILAHIITAAGGGMRGERWRHGGWLALRLPIALAVGAGFGILEHGSTYSGEDVWSYVWRVGFHACATGTSMVAYQAAIGAPDARTRWFAIGPSVLLHYINNYGAVVLSFGGVLVTGLGFVAQILSSAIVLTLAILMVAMLAAPAGTRRALEALVAKLPAETARGA